MKKVRWLSAAAGTAIVAFSLAMPTAAYAAGPSGDTTGLGNLSLLNGNGINLPVSVPIIDLRDSPAYTPLPKLAKRSSADSSATLCSSVCASARCRESCSMQK